MPLSTKNTFEAEIVAGIVATHGDAGSANQAPLWPENLEQHTQVIFQREDTQAREAFLEALVKAIRGGSIRVAGDNVTNTVPVIEVIDSLKTEDNPEASSRAKQLDLAC
jgi:hypothetical protein